ncbi:nuclear transport factor 2 family protein [Mycobacterium bourgelatii]|uniref:Polyketide cyclase n=1 Tax=Mycobacterium bourgelatii TaxID=1273442 RepID=A0A7I9YSK6_MYCBU|nr:nuclear transport factor 2 family protein [Mycobacterium bourgelatii]MCV6976808.1 ester cyclase [Mycobacterium bourgelatii]GFG91615.1 hypothetical protein MBOU_36570 [Mycobacterium bourgelatii]
MHPFVALMRKYCIDYTNSHDQDLYDEIMEPDYVVHINGMSLVRSTTYAQAVRRIFKAAPGLALSVHEFVLNGDRLCMHFSEHAGMPVGGGRALACWRGIGLYKWNGRRLTENYVEQDYFAMQAQMTSGHPHPLVPPHIDPWTSTEPVPADHDAEVTVRSWLERSDLAAAPVHEIDDARTGATYEAVLEPHEVVVNDLFSAGADVPFHVTMRGPYRGGLGAGTEKYIGKPAALHIAGIARVDDGAVAAVKAVTSRSQTLAELTNGA